MNTTRDQEEQDARIDHMNAAIEEMRANVELIRATADKISFDTQQARQDAQRAREAAVLEYRKFLAQAVIAGSTLLGVGIALGRFVLGH